MKIKYLKLLFKYSYVTLPFFLGCGFIWLALSSAENMTMSNINDVNSVLIGIGTGLITTAFTVSIIQYLLDIENKKEIKNKEKEELLRTHKILHLLLYKYLKYFYCVVVPLDERKKEDWNKGTMPLITDFDFTDLRDLSLRVSYPNDPIFLTPIELFYKAEKDLREYMIKVITNNSLNYFSSIKDIFLEFIEYSLGNEHQNKILEDLKTFCGKEKTTKVVTSFFDDTSKDWLSEYEKGKLRSHIMVPYIELYYFLKKEIELIVKYNEEIKKL